MKLWALAVTATLCIVLAPRGQAEDLFQKTFTLICDDVEVHAYRYGVTANKVLREWSTEEKFPGKWVFTWDPRGDLTLDGKLLTVVAAGPYGVIGMSGGQNPTAASSWSYALNFDLRTVVAAQVNTSSVLGPAIKTRIVEFACQLDR